MIYNKLEKSNGQLGQLVKSATGTFGLKVGLIGLSFATSILLARLLGTKGYGIYVYCTAWIALLQVPAELGSRFILGREVSAYASQSQWGRLKGLLRWLNRSVFWVSVGMTMVVAGGVWIFGGDIKDPVTLTFYVALAALPFLALTAVRQGAMQGLHAVVLGQLPENLLQPLLLILSVGIAYFTLGDRLTATWVVLFRGGTVVIAFVVGLLLLRKVMPQEVVSAPIDYEVGRWTSSLLPFILISCTHVINNRTDILMLGLLDSPEASGIYTVASRGATLVTFVLVSVNMSLGPVISGLYANGQLEKLQQTVKKSTRIIFFASLPISVGLIVFNRWFLLLFGSEFLQGSSALIILCIAQMINASAGSVGIILDMTGHERDSAIGIGLSALLNIVLNAILIPIYGLEGAAIATASSIVFWNVFLLICLNRQLGIKSTIFGRI